MPSSPTSPARLHVYLAADAPIGAVLRRGPSPWCRLSLWHTDTDEFEHGQWFRGRVYERRADLAPDGSLFVYFAAKSGRIGRPEAPEDSWIAISRPPHFTALALWWVGSTWCLGGAFVDARTLYITGTDPPAQGELPPWLSLAGTPPHVDGTPNWTDATVHNYRLMRAGWTRVAAPSQYRETWQRRQPGGDRTLVMSQRVYPDFRVYGAPYVVDYSIRREGSDTEHELGRCTWADWDQQGRLTIAQDGRLLRWHEEDRVDVLCDFKPQRPEAKPSPAWAREWPNVPRG